MLQLPFIFAQTQSELRKCQSMMEVVVVTLCVTAALIRQPKCKATTKEKGQMIQTHRMDAVTNLKASRLHMSLIGVILMQMTDYLL